MHTTTNEPDRSLLREKVRLCIYEALIQVCGGDQSTSDLRKRLSDIALTSISFPNKKASSVDGKAHDVEVRIALTLFHRWKRKSSCGTVSLTSDFGLVRTVPSAKDFAQLLCYPLEISCRDRNIAHHVQCSPSGMICIVSCPRAKLLREAGRLPCPQCIQWCKGEKGLWWHQQQTHRVQHSEAALAAASATDTLAIIPYEPNNLCILRTKGATVPVEYSQPTEPETNLDYIKKGNLESLKAAVQTGYNPATELDRRGASPLMWAAGSGHLEIVRYLIEECGCSPGQPQAGKRSFAGRTALHWAARNGHIPVIEFLIDQCQVDIEAATSDGTTAFCWASWKGQISVMKYLSEKGCNIHTTNSFGCNPVLWCAQGKGEVATFDWLRSKGCDIEKVNNNLHGVLHKASQRGQMEVCKWFFDFLKVTSRAESSLNLVGPDAEGHCPSDLAGMEGHEDVARFVAMHEMELVAGIRLRKDQLSRTSSLSFPKWLAAEPNAFGKSMRVSENELYSWEPFGGVRRMRSTLHKKLQQT